MKPLRLVCLAAFVLDSGSMMARAPAGPLPTMAPYGKADADADKKDSTKPPFKGMTKAQALHFYGDPDSVGHRDGEELWTYVLNRGEAYGKSLIPFNFHNSLRYRLLTFKDGKVVDFRWDRPEKE